MPYLFGHLIGAYLITKLCEKITGYKLSNLEYLFLYIGSLLPDIDMLFDYKYATCIHRTFTHSIIGGLIFGLLIYFLLKKFKSNKTFQKIVKSLGSSKTKLKNCVYIFLIAYVIHLMLDMTLNPGIYLFWPIERFVTLYSPYIRIPEQYCTNNDHLPNLIIFETIAGMIWLTYLYVKKRK